MLKKTNMVKKQPIKKPAKSPAKPAAKKAIVKPNAKKTVAKQPAKKPVVKAPLKKAVAKPTVAKKPVHVVVKKAVAKTPVKKADVKTVKKPEIKKPIKKEPEKKLIKAPKPEKPKKAPKPEKIKKPAPPVLSAKEIARKKAAIREALEKELSKKMPEPPPPPIHKRKVEDKNKKPIVIPKVNAKTSKPFNPEFTRSILDTPMQQDSGPLVRYSDTELNEFREIITKKLDAAKRELSYLQGLITRKDEMGGDTEDSHYMTMEDGSMSMEREQLSQMASRQITYIDHLEKAIMRIENKTYGICRVTGKLIDKARLKAVPHATLSIEAKMRQK
jgi:RNA polymerase-binding transcription factor DksA